MIYLNHAQQTAWLLTQGAFMAGAFTVLFAVLWRWDRQAAEDRAAWAGLDWDVEVLWGQRLPSLRRSKQGLLAWARTPAGPLPTVRPSPAPRTADVEPDTIIAHPSSTAARKNELLHRHAAGQTGGRTVDEILADVG